MRQLLYVLVCVVSSLPAQDTSILPATVYALSAACQRAFGEGEPSCRHGTALAQSAMKLNPALGQAFAALVSNGSISSRHSETIASYTSSAKAAYIRARKDIARRYATSLTYCTPTLNLAVEEFLQDEFYFRKGQELSQAFSQVSPDMQLALTEVIDNLGRISNRHRFLIYSLQETVQDILGNEPPGGGNGHLKKVLTVPQAQYLLRLLREGEIAEAEMRLQRALDSVR